MGFEMWTSKFSKSLELECWFAGAPFDVYAFYFLGVSINILTSVGICLQSCSPESSLDQYLEIYHFSFILQLFVSQRNTVVNTIAEKFI